MHRVHFLHLAPVSVHKDLVFHFYKNAPNLLLGSKEEQQHVKDMLVALKTRHYILLAFFEKEEKEDEKERLDRTIRRFVATPRTELGTQMEEKRSDWQYRWQGGLQMTLEVHGKLPAEHRQTCCVCWTDLSQVCLHPCGHLCMCRKCAESGASQRPSSCPICNTIVQGAVKFLTSMQAKEEE